MDVPSLFSFAIFLDDYLVSHYHSMEKSLLQQILSSLRGAYGRLNPEAVVIEGGLAGFAAAALLAQG